MSEQLLISDKLETEAGITALIADRSYMTHLPQNPTYPAVTFRRVSDGQRRATSGIHTARYQMTSYAKTYAAALDVSAALFAAFEDWQTGGTTPSIEATRRTNSIDFHDDTNELHIIADDYILTLCD